MQDDPPQLRRANSLALLSLALKIHGAEAFNQPGETFTDLSEADLNECLSWHNLMSDRPVEVPQWEKD